MMQLISKLELSEIVILKQYESDFMHWQLIYANYLVIRVCDTIHMTW